MFIYQRKNWPNFVWNTESLISLLGKVHTLQGKIVGQMEAIGFELRSEAELSTLTLDILKTSEIEGEFLNPQQVRSSLAKRLGMDIPYIIHSERDVDGVVEMMLDVLKKYDEPLTSDRLFDWQASLFPSGRSGMYKINVGRWRDDSSGPMQVVSGVLGNETVHFQAPPAEAIGDEMKKFLIWFNGENQIDSVLKAGIAHLWFVTVHPFEDGNGRIARALTDMLLARAGNVRQRFYSMSTQIRKERNNYYTILENSQKGELDITLWLEWFLTCLLNALKSADEILNKVMSKHRFWNRYSKDLFNKRQIKMLEILLESFFGKLTTSKWAKITKCSPDTALRDIQDLVGKDILEKDNAGGRSTNYILSLD